MRRCVARKGAMHVPDLSKPRWLHVMLLSFVMPHSFAIAEQDSEPAGNAVGAPHVVFVAGDHEYRSEEILPMLADMMREHLGFRVSVCYPLDGEGRVDPLLETSIAGLEALEDADLMVMYTRFRRLPQDQLDLISQYVESGRPVAGFRTSTHAFRFEEPELAEWNNEWPKRTFGQHWITHHGHFDDGRKPLTRVRSAADAEDHPVLRGISGFDSYSWLYHVQGSFQNREWALDEGCVVLSMGEALRSNQPEEVPRENPVVWVREADEEERRGRLFFTTLGHPFDFKDPMMVNLSLQGFLWAMGRGDSIPESGLGLEPPPDFSPNPSGMSREHIKPDLEPRFLFRP